MKELQLKKKPFQRTSEVVKDNKTIPNDRINDVDQTVLSSTNVPVCRPTQINHQLATTTTTKVHMFVFSAIRIVRFYEVHIFMDFV